MSINNCLFGPGVTSKYNINYIHDDITWLHNCLDSGMHNAEGVEMEDKQTNNKIWELELPAFHLWRMPVL